MSIAILNGFRTSLRYRLTATETVLAIPRADAIKLNSIGIGNYTYLTVKDRTRSEIVRYDHTADWDNADAAVVQLPVLRDQDGGGAKNFAYGSCVLWEVNGLYVNDFIREVLGTPGAAPATSEGPALPTVMVGGRNQILGQPDGYLDLDGKSVPYYNP